MKNEKLGLSNGNPKGPIFESFGFWKDGETGLIKKEEQVDPDTREIYLNWS